MKTKKTTSSIFKSKKKSWGYTLTELLIASMLTAIVVNIAGYGVIAMVGSNQKESADSTMMNYTNRALEFISGEIREADSIDRDAYAGLTKATDFNLPSGATPVLTLNVPGISQPIIYYIDKVENPWLGENAIYRWGPLSEGDDPSSWESVVVLDLADNTEITADATEIKDLCTPDSDWELTTTDAVKGFFACVHPSERLAKFAIYSTVDLPSGRTREYNNNTQAFARRTVADGNTGGNMADAFEIDGRTLVLKSPANVTFKHLGGDITCGAGGVDIPVKTNLYFGDSNPVELNVNGEKTLPNLPKDTEVTVESIAGQKGICGNFSMTVRTDNPSDAQQVYALRDGDPIPDITPFDNQSTIDDFLEQYLDPDTGKVKLKDNEVIYLFELGTKNKNSPAFDLQDNVVLATINPIK